MSAVPAPRRILVTRLRFLGDIVLSLPLLSHLRERFPQASLEYLVERRFAPVLERHPALDRLHLLPDGASVRQMLGMLPQLRRPRIDWWIDLLTNPRSCVLALLAQPRVGVGSARGLRSRVYRHRRVRPGGDPSALHHHLDKLVPLCGELPLRLPELVLAAKPKLPFAAPAHGVLLHPGSTWPDKAWPREAWIELCARLGQAGIGPLCFVRPPGEDALIEELCARCGLPATPQLDLAELLALVAACRLYIGNDGGVLHCAVALRRPTLGLFGPTDPDIWFPYARFGPYRVLRGSDGGPAALAGEPHARLRDLDAATVCEAARALWVSA